jgi:hypothetical protein
MKMYVVRHPDGNKFFKRQASNMGRNLGTWVGMFDKAKIFDKLRNARSTVTWYANLTGKVCDILEFELVQTCVLTETDRVEKVMQKREEEEVKRARQRYEREMQEAKEDYERALNRLKKVTKV